MATKKYSETKFFGWIKIFTLTAFLMLPLSLANAAAYLPAPANPSASVGVGSVTISWDAGANGTGGETGYAIDLSLNGSTYDPFATLLRTPGVIRYTQDFPGMNNGEKYWFKVRGTYTSYSSPSLYFDPVVTLVSTTVPRIGAYTDTSINLAFTAPANNNLSKTNYSFYLADDANSQFYYLRTDGTPGPFAEKFAALANDSRWNGFRAVGLTPNSLYAFRIFAQTAEVLSANLSDITPQIRTLARPPTNLAAVPIGNNGLIVNWSSDPSIYFNVRNLNTGQESGWRASNTYAFSNLACGTQYNFTVQSRNSDNVGGVQVPVSGATGACSSVPPADPPTNLNTYSVSTTTISVAWAIKPSLFYNVKNVTTGRESGWLTGDGFNFTGLNCGAQYNFTVQSKNSAGASSALVPVTGNTLSCPDPTPLPSVTSVTVTNRSQTTVTLAWTGVGSSFRVKNLTSGVDSGWVASSPYTYSNLTCNTAYSFEVEGKNGASISFPYPASATTLACDTLPIVSSTSSSATAPATTLTDSSSGLTTEYVTEPVSESQSSAVSANKPSSISPECPELNPGDQIKVAGFAPIYVVNDKYEVLTYPNANPSVYFSWVDGGKYIYKKITLGCYESLKPPARQPLFVNYRPGSFVIKRGSSPQWFVIQPGNAVAKITQTAAKALYGASVKPVAVSNEYFGSYVNEVAEINRAKPHPGMVIKKDNKTWFVASDSTIQEVTKTGLTANGFQTRFIRPVSASSATELTPGQPLSGEDTSLTDKTQSDYEFLRN